MPLGRPEPIPDFLFNLWITYFTGKKESDGPKMVYNCLKFSIYVNHLSRKSP